jgi:large subunit ribosomal protein L25
MLEGIIRDSINKANAKKLRRDGYLIANIYGKNFENISCAFKRNEFIKAVKKKTTLALSVKVGEKECDVVIQEYQKDPITADLQHVDLLVAQKGIENYFYVPVTTVGSPVGLKNKGLLAFHRKRVKVKAKPENLPKSFELNVAPLNVDDSISVKDLVLPENVKCYLNPSIAIVGVIKAK